MIFKSDKSVGIGVIMCGATALVLLCIYQIFEKGGSERWVSIILFVLICLFPWMWFGTYYEIDGKQLRYRSGPVHGFIAIDSIHTIVAKTSMYVGLKPALAGKGCIIKYNKWDDIYLSPKDQARFIEELVKINPAIIVKEPEGAKS